MDHSQRKLTILSLQYYCYPDEEWRVPSQYEGWSLNQFDFSPDADVRSPKVKQMLDNSNCTALFYDKEERTQLRFKCIAICNHKNNQDSILKGFLLQTSRALEKSHFWKTSFWRLEVFILSR